MNAPTDWVSAIAILAAGLILGLLVFFFFSRRRSARQLGEDLDLERKDLEARRDALIDQLRELEGDPKHTPQQLADERRRLELETAAVLRQLDEAGTTKPAAEAAEEAADPGPAMNPAVKGFLWGAGSFAALFGLAWFVMNSATPREEGGSPTGGMPAAAQQAPQNPMIAGLEAAVAKEPGNLQLRNDLAQAYLENNNLMGVFEQTKVVLDRTPDDSRALTLQGLVRMAMGEAEMATSMLQKATKVDPKNLDGWVALAWVFAQQGKMGDAEKMIAEAKKQSPADTARLDQIFTEMKGHAMQAAQAPAGAGGQLPAGHPPVDGAAPAQAAAASAGPEPGMARPAPPADGRSIRLTLDLDPGATTRSGIVFVIARGPQGGAPVAVKRMMATQFPMTFDFGSADSMMGQPLPERFRLEARLDTDGDAATKPPTDPNAAQDGVTPGAVVKLALK